MLNTLTVKMSNYYIVDPNEFRQNIRDKIAEKMNTIVSVELPTNYIINLEIGIFNYAIKEADQRKVIKKWDNPPFVNIYMDRLRSIYTNLKNQSIIDRIIAGELAPQTLAFMSHPEMNHERWKTIIEAKMKRDSAKYNTEVKAMTDLFQCRKCKSKKCTYVQIQTRSADEPMTTLISCIDCGANWKKNG